MEAQLSKINGGAIAIKIDGSVAQNARDLGISRQHLSNIIKGRKTPSAQLLLKIQTFFGMSAEQLTKKS